MELFLPQKPVFLFHCGGVQLCQKAVSSHKWTPLPNTKGDGELPQRDMPPTQDNQSVEERNKGDERGVILSMMLMFVGSIEDTVLNE